MGVAQLIPPVFDHRTRELLVDGGYASNLPVNAMREGRGSRFVREVVAVDVEDKDHSAYEGVLPYSNYYGLSGFLLLVQVALRMLLKRLREPGGVKAVTEELRLTALAFEVMDLPPDPKAEPGTKAEGRALMRVRDLGSSEICLEWAAPSTSRSTDPSNHRHDALSRTLHDGDGL